MNMVSCSWTPSLTVSIGTQFPPGDYLFKLLAVSGQESYVPLTIADPGSHATYLVQNSIMIWQAWNNYGGYDMYGGTPGKSPRYADRSRVLSFDRPYAYGGGAADFLGNELPLVEFLEQHGLDVSYVSDIAVNDDPSLILAHKVFLSLGHDECWAMAQRNGISQAITRGVNVVFFGASPILRHVRMQAAPTGPDREMVDYRVPNQDPIYRTDPKDATGNTWAEPPADAPPSEITGDTYSGYGINAPMVISDASAWVFTGTGLHNGSSLPHVVRSDYDRYVRNHFTPRNVQVLTASPVVTSSGAHGTANMTYYTNPTSNAGVLSDRNQRVDRLDGPVSQRHDPVPRPGGPSRYHQHLAGVRRRTSRSYGTVERAPAIRSPVLGGRVWVRVFAQRWSLSTLSRAVTWMEPGAVTVTLVQPSAAGDRHACPVSTCQ